MKIELFGNRRAFLKLAALFGGVGVLLASGRPAAAEPKRSQPEPGPSGQGYRLTDQVKKYYETARLP
jgi:hypothetical protein